ncbi:MAG: ABC transporter permease [Planctomyces sp.]|nr:ABC transporter permease [Planctomyces sp.]
MIPVRYNVRNLRVRWMTTLMTVIGTALVVAASVLTLSLIAGIDHALRISGHELDLIALRKGSTDEISSGLEQKVAREVSSLPGIARDAAGQPLCSVEFVTILTKPRRNNQGTTNIIVRGLEPVGRSLRPDFKITEGRDLNPGLNEAITSRQMAERFENLRLGEKLEINKRDFTVVGYFEASGSSAESEVWTDLKDVTLARATPEVATTVNLRAQDMDARKTLIDALENDKRFLMSAVTEIDYFKEQLSASYALWVIGIIIASFLIVGASFAASNTMFAAVASRSREIGTLRALGFDRRAILISFLLESVILCSLGGVLGCICVLPFSGFSTGTANWQQFSEITFSARLSPLVLSAGILLAVGMGLFGGLLPAIRAVGMNIITALRER